MTSIFEKSFRYVINDFLVLEMAEMSGKWIKCVENNLDMYEMASLSEKWR